MSHDAAHYLKYAGLSLLALLAPIKPIMITVGVLIVADAVTGMMAARKRGEKLTSAAMRRTVSKCLVYQLAVLTGFLAEKYLLDGIFPVSKAIAGIIGVTEVVSILENAGVVLGRNLFAALIGKLGSQNDTKDSK